MKNRKSKHHIRLLLRIKYLKFFKKNRTDSLVNDSYNRISSGYDDAWTNHMRHLTGSLIDALDPQPGDHCIDLTCGTGFATGLLAEKTGTTVTGVDRSEGMLKAARNNCNGKCRFIQDDILEFLRKQPAESIDIATCCWGLGYSRPSAVLKQIKRILRPGGKVAIIDNSLFSLSEIILCSMLTFAEQPEKLENLMQFHFLPNSRFLRLRFRFAGLKPIYHDDGTKTYHVGSGSEAIERLRATGAAAGFEYAARAGSEDEVFTRFAEIIEEKYLKPEGIAINHRYLAGIARK